METPRNTLARPHYNRVRNCEFAEAYKNSLIKKIVEKLHTPTVRNAGREGDPMCG